MWESPIRIIEENLQTQIKDEVFSAIRRAGFDIDKDELIKALNYDRKQYEKGFRDGYAKAKSDIIRCKDCKHSEHWYRDKCRCFLWAEDGIDVFDEGFCSYAERREE